MSTTHGPSLTCSMWNSRWVCHCAQTGRALDKKLVELPEIATLGTYDASLRLHPEVLGTFKVVVVKDKSGL